MLERITFTPKWLADAEGEAKPAFSLRAGSVLERDKFEAELEGEHRAGLVLSFQLLEAALGGLQALLEPDAAEPLVALVQSEFGGEDLSPTEKAQVKGATDILAEHWPPYRSLVEQEARRNALLPTLAFVRYCDGWENVKDDDGATVEYGRDKLGQLDASALRSIPFAQIRSAGLEAYKLQYGRHQAKN